MSHSPSALPRIFLIRHGETEWSLSGKHTGLSDIPLTARGEQGARALGSRLHGVEFDMVFASPLIRARRTCELAGLGGVAINDPDLVEWNYGDYEGKRIDEIRQINPDWQLFRDGCPGGESVGQAVARVDRVIARIRAFAGRNAAIFSSGHTLRLVAARWLQLDAPAGDLLFLDTASISILGYNHDLTEPVIRRWNDTGE